MMVKVAFILLAVVCVVSASTAADESAFQSWMRHHGKTYRQNEFAHRLSIFSANLKRISSLNAANPSTIFALNQFADLSAEEFKRTHLMQLGDGPVHPTERVLPSIDVGDLPASFDWRDKGAVTPVKDQGSVGSCWAFSTTGNVEGQLFLAHGSLTALSEEQLVDCDVNDCGVFGGWPYRAMEFIIASGGLQTETDYPYCSGTGQCYPCMANTNKTFCGPGPSYCARNCSLAPGKPRYTISDWASVSQDESEIAAALVAKGPLSVLLDAALLQFYHKGVFDPPDWACSKTDLDHAVLLVGYGTEKDVLGSKDFWLIKNSWGTKWGEDGYFRILRGSGKCGVNTQVITAVV